jgi:hypothetical protein
MMRALARLSALAQINPSSQEESDIQTRPLDITYRSP